MAKNRKGAEIYVRNFIFGVEDSLVSTVGLLSGIAVAGVDRRDIFLTGIILVFVEAFSMGVGSFLSEDTAEELVAMPRTKKISEKGALIMFVSYFISGIIPIFPYLVFSVESAFIFSNVLSLATLFLLGALTAKFYNKSVLKIGFRMLVLGGFAIAIGILVGKLLATR